MQTILYKNVIETNKYKIMNFLFILTYLQHAKLKLVQMLLIFIMIFEFRAIKLLNYVFFNLLHNYKSNKKILINVTNYKTRSYNSCSKFNLLQFFFETFSNVDERRRIKHRKSIKKCFDRFVNDFIC